MIVSVYPVKLLGEILQLELDEEPIDRERTYLTAGIYSHGRGIFRRAPIEGSETRYTKYTKLHVGQFVYSKLFGWEGATTVVGSDFDGLYVSHEFPTFSINNAAASPDYVGYLARWKGLHSLLKDKGTGVGSRRQRVGIDRLLATPVPLPDLAEQSRIVARLDAAFSRLSKADGLLSHRELLRNSLAESAVFATASQSAGSAPLKSLLTVSRVPVEIIPDNQYQAFGMRSFGKGTIRYNPRPGRDLSVLRYYTFPAGALALSNIKAWEGAIGVTDVKDTSCVASNRFLFYSPKDGRINLSYLRHYLLSREGIAKISAASPGSADRNRTLSIQGLESIEIPLPPRNAQDRAARLIDTINTRLSSAESTATWETLRPSLLNAAFGGRL